MAMRVERCSKILWRVVIDRTKNGVAVHVNDAYDWCKAQWDRGGRRLNCAWRYGWDNQHHFFYFNQEENMTFFLLRWQ